MKLLFIFSIVILILLYFLYNTINQNIELFKNSDFEFNIDTFNKMFSKQQLLKKNDLEEVYEGDIDTIYYNKPFKKNSLLLNDFNDTGILKNIRIQKHMYTYGQEISYQTLQKILDKILSVKEFNLDLNTNIINEKSQLKIYKNVSKFFVNKINFYLKEFDLEIDKHKTDTRKFKYLNNNIIKDDKIENLTEDNRRIIFNITIYREDKIQYFTLQVVCNYNYVFNKIKIEKMDIIGIFHQEDIAFTDLKNKKKIYCSHNSNKKEEQCFPDINPENLSLENYEKKLNNEIHPKILNKKIKERNEYIEYQKHKCFLKKGFNEPTCKSYDFDKKTHGVWDKPCINDLECPFYKKNKNYENTRGGCINGFCEMPVNIEKVGYKHYKLYKKPFCHNCNIKDCSGENCFNCCEEQKNKKIYPNLKSPHYMFSNDGI